jgi:hypothetical protein
MSKQITSVTLLIIVLSFSSGLSYRVDDFRVNQLTSNSEIFSIQLSTNGKGMFAVTWLDVYNSPTNDVYMRIYRVDGTAVSPPVKIPNIIDNGQVLRNMRIENKFLPNGVVVLVRDVKKDSVDAQGQPYGAYRAYIDLLDTLGNQLVPPFRGGYDFGKYLSIYRV